MVSGNEVISGQRQQSTGLTLLDLFLVNKMSISIEEISILNGICPLCLGIGLLPRREYRFTCTLCLGSGEINITKEKGEEIMAETLKRSQDFSCCP